MAFPSSVRPSQVYVAVEGCRLVYVTGDLLQPRMIELKPRQTLRQAVALASVGEAGQPRQRAIREGMKSALLDLSRVYAGIWSLKKLLGTGTPEDYENILVAEFEVIRAIAKLETSMVAARAAEREQRKRVIDESIRRAESRLAALMEQKVSEEDGWRLDEQIASEVRALFERNSPLAPASRLAEARRSALVSASRVLQLEVAAENMRTELADLHAQAAALEAGAESGTWSELSDALTLAQQKRAQLAALQAAASGILEGDVLAVITRPGLVLAPVSLAAEAAGQELQLAGY